jgi:hypothetical protein
MKKSNSTLIVLELLHHKKKLTGSRVPDKKVNAWNMHHARLKYNECWMEEKQAKVMQVGNN